MKPFRTHTGETVTGERLANACRQVAADTRQLAHDIREENAYAAHVTEATKAEAERDMLARADAIERGEVNSVAVWQRINTVLTGECVALLP